MERHAVHPLRLLALFVGPLLGILPILISMPPFETLSVPAWRLVGLTAWMALWWFSECVPIPATALLPLVWMPLTGIADEKTTASRYADPIVFLFLGGFILAQGMQATGLHQRIAVGIIRLVGSSPAQLVGGFMVATAFISMWVNNTSTTMMMFAVALPILESVRRSVGHKSAHGFGLALMLGIAYSASIGGVGTLVGTAPNALLAGFLRENYGYSLTMANWLWIGLPFVLLMLPFTWFWLTRIATRLHHLEGQTFRMAEDPESEPLSMAEKGMIGVFLCVVAGWLLRQKLSEWTGVALSDSTIAILGAVALFILPATRAPWRPILDWRTAENIPWGVLILFGGGLALAGAFESTGLAKAIGSSVEALKGVSPWVMVLVVATLIIFLTELTSNTATTATFLPVVSAVAVGLGIDPRLLAIPVAVGASAAFMLPVATPPNAIVFASGEVQIHEMARTGFALNLWCIATVMLIMLTTARWGLGI